MLIGHVPIYWEAREIEMTKSIKMYKLFMSIEMSQYLVLRITITKGGLIINIE